MFGTVHAGHPGLKHVKDFETSRYRGEDIHETVGTWGMYDGEVKSNV